MNKVEFLEKIKDILQTDADINFETNLLEVDEWDSLSIISTVAFLSSEFSKEVRVSDLKEVKTIEDLAKVAGL